jgi:broad specificity phosphatase PhoE
VTTDRTVVHLLRHGEVDNPGKVLYGRLPGYHLSERGQEMARRLADFLAHHDTTVLVSSPLERAQETAEPLAAKLGLPVHSDDRLTEADNKFQGLTVGVGDGALRNPRYWRHLWNPFTPSWGEPYVEVSRRMRLAVADAARQARGHEAVLVSHQMPIWVARLAAEHRPFVHDPRRRECSLASLTSLIYDQDGRMLSVSYSEPAADLLPGASTIPGA